MEYFSGCAGSRDIVRPRESQIFADGYKPESVVTPELRASCDRIIAGIIVRYYDFIIQTDMLPDALQAIIQQYSGIVVDYYYGNFCCHTVFIRYHLRNRGVCSGTFSEEPA